MTDSRTRAQVATPDDDPDQDGDDEFEFDVEFDCRMGPDGQCGQAGSEDCDFECPYHRRRA